MDFVLVFPLILAFLSTGQSHTGLTGQNWNSCQVLCPPGYYKAGDCDGSDPKLRCEKCHNGTYTDIPNSSPKCQRCKACGNLEVEIKPCSFNSNAECNCRKGYFYKIKPSPDGKSLQKGSSLCRDCSSNCKDLGDYPDYKKMCPPCQSSSDIPESPDSPTTTPTNNTSRPVVVPYKRRWTEMLWLVLVVVLVTPLVFLWFLLFFRYVDGCLSSSVNKAPELPVEDPIFNEQSVHQGSSPDTMTFIVSEETPMMTLSPATPKHPDAEHKATRQEEQPEHWPAIVLYAIIKEVPLRRWKEFLRLLSVADQQMERVELEAGLGLGSMERQYQMLRLWCQRPSASMNDIFSALHYMDLSGCAQLLQESLEKLQ